MTVRAVLLALAPALLGGAMVVSGAAERPAAPLPAISPHDWAPQPGDLVLTAADDLIGANIRGASGSNAVFSHVGLVVLRDGAPAVIEATPFGSGKVAFADFDAFTRNPETTELLVLRPRTPIDLGRLAHEAERLAAAGVEFDYGFDMADASELYCAELVYHLLGAAGVNLASVPWTQMYVPLHGDRNLVVPDAFAHTPALEPVFRRRLPPATPGA
jgi:hypothetical protein